MASSSPQPNFPKAYEFFSNGVPMWIYDVASLFIVEVNNAAVESYGYSRADFLKMTILDIRPVTDMREVMRSAIKAHPVTGQIWRHRKQDGTIFEVQVTSTDIQFEGRLSRMVTAMPVESDRGGDNASATSNKPRAQN